MLFVEDLKNKPEDFGLPQEFVDCLPKECPTCGALMAISESLTGLHCSNPRCGDKIAKRIEALCKDIDVLGMGEVTVGKFVEYYELTNPLMLFSLTKGMAICEGMSQEVADNIIDQIDSKRRLKLWEYVKFANLPGIRSSARDIFGGYFSLSDAYKDIESGGVKFIQDKLGISGSEGISVRAAEMYATLIEYKDDLFECESYVSIRNPKQEGVVELNVVCSDKVGGDYKTKKEFYNDVKTIFEGVLEVNFLDSVKKSIDYLVWAGADGTPSKWTSKVNKVTEWNEKGCSIPIVTATQFIAELKELYL